MRLNDLINQQISHYRIDALIGRGGMAAVYRAFDTRLHRFVALKVLYPQYLADPDIVERFRREAITAAQLDHPHIAPIYDVGDFDGLHYLAMKLLPGPSLAEVLQREHRLPLERIAPLAFEVADALDEAHSHGIVHRDIKPGNVIFDERGRAVLTDFGIAKSLDSPALTESSVIVGTPDYIAPEQIDPRMAPSGQIDHRADLYSMAALLYRTLTGRRPFDGSAQTVLLAHLRDDPPPPSTLLPDLPPAVDAVFARGLAKNPADRFDSALDLAQALGEALGDRTEIGTVFPPTHLRRNPHTRPTTQVVPQHTVPAPIASAASAATIAPPFAAEPVAPGRRPKLWLIALPIVLLIGMALSPPARELFASMIVPPTPESIAVVPIVTATRTAAPTRTATSTRTIAPAPSATPAPSVSPTAEPTIEPTITPQPQQAVAGSSSTASRPVVRPTAKPQPTARPTNAPPKVQPTVRPTAKPQPTAVPPTPVPATPVPEPTTVACKAPLQGGFGELWRTNEGIRRALGCPTAHEQASYSVEQLFENGLMYYRDDEKWYWVLNGGTSGSWRFKTDVYLSDPEPADEAPAGLITPKNGFGRLWQKYPDIREALGWATTGEVPFTGVVQPFEYGTMLYAQAVNNHRARIYVLYNSGSYDIFLDTYTGP